MTKIVGIIKQALIILNLILSATIMIWGMVTYHNIREALNKPTPSEQWYEDQQNWTPAPGDPPRKGRGDYGDYYGD